MSTTSLVHSARRSQVRVFGAPRTPPVRSPNALTGERRVLCKKLVVEALNINDVFTQDKNSMEYNLESYNETFVIPKKLLTFVTLRMTHDISDFRAKCWNVFFWIEVLNISTSIVVEFTSILVTSISAHEFHDCLKVFRLMPCFGACVMSIIKSVKLYTNRPVFEELYHELREMWPRGTVTEDEHHIISIALKQLNFINKGYYWCNNILLVSFLTPPLAIKVSQYFGYNTPDVLTFDYWLPFNPFQPYVHEIVLIQQTWGAVVVIYFNVLWDMLFCTYLAHITLQFQLLARRVRRLIYVPVDKQLAYSYPLAVISRELLQDQKEALNSFSDQEWEIRHQQELIDIVKKHHTLIRFADTVEGMFSFALLVNLMYSSVIICLCGFCCVLLEKWNELAYKTYLVTALAQTWLMCWYGQQLLDSSYGMSVALFESGWYMGSKRIKSAVLIMLQRAQNGIHVTTYGFSNISLQSFSTIIKTSWSYFTLLLNFYTRGR